MKRLVLLLFSIFLVYSCSNNSSPDDTNNYKPVATVKADLEKVFSNYDGYNCARFSKDGKLLVMSVNENMQKEPQEHPGHIILFDIATKSKIKSYELTWQDEFNYGVLSPDGAKVAACGACYNGWFGNGLIIWDAKSGSTLHTTNKLQGSYLEFSSTGDTLFVYSGYNMYRWIPALNKTEKIEGLDFFCGTTYFKMSSDYRYFAMGDSPCVNDISDASKSSYTIELNDNSISYIDFLPDNNTVIAVKNNHVYSYDLKQKKVNHHFADNYLKYHYAMAVSKSGKYFATTYNVGEDEYSIKEEGIQIWDAETLAQVGKIKLNYGASFLEFGPDDSQLLFVAPNIIEVYKINYTKL